MRSELTLLAKEEDKHGYIIWAIRSCLWSNSTGLSQEKEYMHFRFVIIWCV